MDVRQQSDMILKLMYEIFLGIELALREGLSVEQMVAEYEEELTRRGFKEWMEAEKSALSRN